MFQQNLFRYGVLALLFIIILFAMLNKESSFNTYQQSMADRFIGKKLDFSNIVDVENKKFSPELPAMIHVFTNYCKYCKNDLALFRRLEDRSNYRIYGLIWSDQLSDAKVFTANYPHDYDEILFSTAPNIFIELGVKGIPITIVVGVDGEILYYKAHSLNFAEIQSNILPKLSMKTN
ncbi:MAG: hypothetical protein LW826_03705 [Candidatus Jidaibacter sp.]|jgi:thiol-disulfide isomerase/thioredoxin|nr:hypothetical protein [Candidatus Jidaibacter sp.]